MKKLNSLLLLAVFFAFVCCNKEEETVANNNNQIQSTVFDPPNGSIFASNVRIETLKDQDGMGFYNVSGWFFPYRQLTGTPPVTYVYLKGWRGIVGGFRISGLTSSQVTDFVNNVKVNYETKRTYNGVVMYTTNYGGIAKSGSNYVDYSYEFTIQTGYPTDWYINKKVQVNFRKPDPSNSTKYVYQTLTLTTDSNTLNTHGFNF